METGDCLGSAGESLDAMQSLMLLIRLRGEGAFYEKINEATIDFMGG
jgi:hypothetical protein